jgi:GT2 family glycosyltransferase
MHNPPLVAVVILNYNGKHHLSQFLPSVVAATYPNQHIIVADNASTDDSVSWLRTHYPNIRLIQLAQNFGFAKGYNEALKQVTADYYVLLNSDVEVTPAWLEPMVQLALTDATIAACQPKLLAYHQKDSFEYAGACGGWIDSLGYPFSRGRIFEVCEKDLGQYDQAQPIFWASGAALFIQASVYHALHGLDEFFFAHQEEIDLCWRLQLAGYTVMACPQAVVYHVGGGTLPVGERKIYLNFRNNLIMLWKNLSTVQKLRVFPLRLLLDLAAVGKNLLGKQFGFVRAIGNAYKDFLGWLFMPQPRKWYPQKKIISPLGRYKGWIVVDYFVRHKKTFSEIIGEEN